MKRLLCLTLLLTPILLAAQQQSGSISGRVLTANGEPAAGIRVGAVTAVQAALPGSPLLTGLGQTDAAGRYRLEDIPPGRYLVAAGSLDAPTYHPGVLLTEKATVVSVPSGGQVTGIDFQMKVFPSVSGRVEERFSPERTEEQVVIRLSRTIPALFQLPQDRLNATVNADGTFRFVDVRPGAYSIEVPGRTMAETKTIEVLDKDVTGLNIVTFRPAVVLTSISFHGNDGPDVLSANCVSCPVAAYPVEGRMANVSAVVVTLSFSIGKDGRVRNAQIVSGHPLFRQSALDAVEKWRFRPRLENGEPVESTASVSLHFRAL